MGHLQLKVTKITTTTFKLMCRLSNFSNLVRMERRRLESWHLSPTQILSGMDNLFFFSVLFNYSVHSLVITAVLLAHIGHHYYAISTNYSVNSKVISAVLLAKIAQRTHCSSLSTGSNYSVHSLFITTVLLAQVIQCTQKPSLLCY